MRERHSMATPEDEPSLLIDKKDLANLLRIGTDTVERMEQDGRIPAPVVLGPRTKRWRRAEILKWVDDGCPSCGAE